LKAINFPTEHSNRRTAENRQPSIAFIIDRPIQFFMNTASPTIKSESSSVKNRARVSLELDDKIKSKLDKIRERSGASTLSEVFRRSLSLYDVVLENYSQGGELIFINPDGTEKRIHLV
jgi:hypothetical protein